MNNHGYDEYDDYGFYDYDHDYGFYDYDHDYGFDDYDHDYGFDDYDHDYDEPIFQPSIFRRVWNWFNKKYMLWKYRIPYFRKELDDIPF